MSQDRRPDESATFVRRITKMPDATRCALGGLGGSCPDVWELSDGNVAIVGRDLTEAYSGRLPDGVGVASDERLVVVPRELLANILDDAA
ncbi:hypothetical protein [Phytohabitans suffuscus]|uniref:Uncharacterized protein n=1 Tax=Phytohabitans suffuscus TaxID=624315 RepID=A0A6F8Z1P9_9ACTN|nr:hypothetical protein [Phytohabitans suffuscus]BCB92021.1 hypothetical protein Psuf_093340 [Phytohabitans suffuscus]